MAGRLGVVLATAFTLLSAPPAWSQSLVAAVLPSSRSVQVGTPATAFAIIINSGTTTATSCSIAPVTSVPATFVYQTTNPATNAVTGTPNTPVNIAAGAAQSYVVAFTPTAPFAPTDVQLSFDCTNTVPAPVSPGLNTLLLSASLVPGPDVVALAATTTNDGIVTGASVGAVAAFAVATVNVGASGLITATAHTGSASFPVSLRMCQTNPVSGACVAPPSSNVTTTMSGGTTGTFGVFVTFVGVVSFDPAVNRVLVRFTDGNGITRGATSVAVRVQPSLLGSFHGTGTGTQAGCQDPDNNGSFGVVASLNVTSQTNDRFSGTGTATVDSAVDNFNVQGSVSPLGAVTATFTFNTFVSGFFFGSGDGTANGQLSGNLLTLNLSAQFRVGETCRVTGVLQLSR